MAVSKLPCGRLGRGSESHQADCFEARSSFVTQAATGREGIHGRAEVSVLGGPVMHRRFLCIRSPPIRGVHFMVTM